MNGRLQSLMFAVALAASTAVLGACGGGGGGSSAPSSGLPSTSSTPPASAGTASAKIALTLQQYTPVDTSAKHRRVAYVSPATAQISLTVTSVNGVAYGGSPMTFPVSPSSPGCAGANGVVTCALSANIPIGSDVLSATTLDANGHSLGTSTITATIMQNATNSIPLAVGGIIASLQIFLTQSHFVPGTAANALVIVVPLDPSGAQIVNPGDYATPIAVTSSSSAGGHLSLTTDGTNTGQSATINSPNDEVTLAYDGGGTSGGTTLTASAGAGITASANASISAAGLSANPGGAYVPSSHAFIFTAAGQTGTINIGGGSAPYTVTSSDPTVATVSGTSPNFTVTAVGYGIAGTTTLTITDSLSAQVTIPVTFIAPPITVNVTTCGGTTCTATGATYSIPLSGPAGALSPTTIALSNGTGSYSYFFISTGTQTSSYASISQTGSSLTITPSGYGNDAIVIASGNQTAYFTIEASADAFGQALPRAIGLVYENVGKYYAATLPATVVSGSAVPVISGFMCCSSSVIDATPTGPANGYITFTNSFGTATPVPYTVFGLTFSTYTGSGASSSSEQTVPAGAPGADEQFTGTGETDTVTVNGLSGSLSAASSNLGVVNVSTGTNTVTVSAVGAGTTTVTLTDNGNGASASYTVSVTSTTVPISGIHRHL